MKNHTVGMTRWIPAPERAIKPLGPFCCEPHSDAPGGKPPKAIGGESAAIRLDS